MKKLFFLASLILLSNCKKQNLEIIEGGVYVKLIDIGSLHKAPKEKLKKIKDKVANGISENDSENDILLINFYEKLLKYDLLDKPYFRIKMNNDSIVSIYTNEENYNEVNSLIKSLDMDNEKILIKLKGEKKESNLYYMTDIISVKKIKGKTDWDK